MTVTPPSAAAESSASTHKAPASPDLRPPPSHHRPLAKSVPEPPSPTRHKVRPMGVDESGRCRHQEVAGAPHPTLRSARRPSHPQTPRRSTGLARPADVHLSPLRPPLTAARMRRQQQGRTPRSLQRPHRHPWPLPLQHRLGDPRSVTVVPLQVMPTDRRP